MSEEKREYGILAAASPMNGMIEIWEKGGCWGQRIIDRVSFGGGEHYVPYVGKQVSFTRCEDRRCAKEVRPGAASADWWRDNKDRLLAEFRKKCEREGYALSAGYGNSFASPFTRAGL